MENQALIDIMTKMLSNNKFSALKEMLIEMNVVDIAQAMTEMAEKFKLESVIFPVS